MSESGFVKQPSLEKEKINDNMESIDNSSNLSQLHFTPVRHDFNSI